MNDFFVSRHFHIIPSISLDFFDGSSIVRLELKHTLKKMPEFG